MGMATTSFLPRLDRRGGYDHDHLPSDHDPSVSGESKLKIENAGEVWMGIVPTSPFPRLEKGEAMATSHFPHREGSWSMTMTISVSFGHDHNISLHAKENCTTERVEMGMATTSVVRE